MFIYSKYYLLELKMTKYVNNNSPKNKINLKVYLFSPFYNFINKKKFHSVKIKNKLIMFQNKGGRMFK